MQAKLIVVGGKASKAEIALKLPTIIGRSREAGLTVAHPMISRKHCELFEADGLLMVRDLESLNGTVVGGQKVKEAPLPPDCEFTVGPLTFRAQYKYDGDLGTLPAAVPAEAGGGGMPDFEPVEEPTLGEPVTTDAGAQKAEQEVSFFDEILGTSGEAADVNVAELFDAEQSAAKEEPEEPEPISPPKDGRVRTKSASASTAAPAVQDQPQKEESSVPVEQDADIYSVAEEAQSTPEQPPETPVEDIEEGAAEEFGEPVSPGGAGKVAKKKAGSWFGGLLGGLKKAKPSKAAAKPAQKPPAAEPDEPEETVEEPAVVQKEASSVSDIFSEAAAEPKTSKPSEPADPDDIFDDFLDNLK